jgi:riboflavin synthase
MFTGIVEDKGRVERISLRGGEKRLTIEMPPNLTEVQLGDSINVNGACLTVAGMQEKRIEVDLSSETLDKTTLGELREGDRVNLERALRISDRLGGHIVTGHIDGIGVISEAASEREFLRFSIQLPAGLSRYVVEKGSIAIDGVSLTVNLCRGDEIGLTLIPYTLAKTTLIEKKTGGRVNVETDLLGKYVEKILGRDNQKREGLDEAFLKKHGFIREE